MRRSVAVLRGACTALHQQLSTVGRQTERTLLLGTVLLALTVSSATGVVLARYFSVDVLSSLSSSPKDCWANWDVGIGSHCFSDYPVVGSVATRPNPWEVYWLHKPGQADRPLRIEYSGAALVPYMLFWSLGKWLGASQLVMVTVLVFLAVALLIPAIWAVAGARGLERVVVFVACGAIAVPSWIVIDRGNSVGFVVPIALIFLVALSRRRWGLVAIMVVLAAVLKPQFVVLAIALFGARKWRLGAATITGAVITNLAAYLLWPRDFPATIGQSIHNVAGYTTSGSIWVQNNVSFANGLIFPVNKTLGAMGANGIPEGVLDSVGWLVGYVVLVAVGASVVALGRRIDPLMAGIALVATASLFPPLSFSYYLVFVLPVAALVARDPDGPPGSGIFDRLAALGDRRRVVGVLVSMSAALSIAQIALPFPPHRQPTMDGSLTITYTTSLLTPLAWLITCAAIIVSYALRPASLASR